MWFSAQLGEYSLGDRSHPIRSRWSALTTFTVELSYSLWFLAVEAPVQPFRKMWAVPNMLEHGFLGPEDIPAP
jgi:hypothetical protein